MREPLAVQAAQRTAAFEQKAWMPAELQLPVALQPRPSLRLPAPTSPTHQPTGPQRRVLPGCT